MNKIRVLVVDDHAVLRDGIRALLDLYDDIEIIGEAASKVTDETKSKFPTISWASIIGMRNRLIHAYYDIDLDRVWDTVVDDLPSLIDI